MTAAREVAFDFAGMRRRELRRALVVSAAAHVALLMALIIVPEKRSLSLPRFANRPSYRSRYIFMNSSNSLSESLIS